MQRNKQIPFSLLTKQVKNALQYHRLTCCYAALLALFRQQSCLYHSPSHALFPQHSKADSDVIMENNMKLSRSDFIRSLSPSNLPFPLPIPEQSTIPTLWQSNLQGSHQVVNNKNWNLTSYWKSRTFSKIRGPSIRILVLDIALQTSEAFRHLNKSFFFPIPEKYFVSRNKTNT